MGFSNFNATRMHHLWGSQAIQRTPRLSDSLQSPLHTEDSFRSPVPITFNPGLDQHENYRWVSEHRKFTCRAAKPQVVNRMPKGARVAVAQSLAECVAKVAAENDNESVSILLTFTYGLTNIIYQAQCLSFVPPPDIQTFLSQVHSNQNKIKQVESKLSDGNVRGVAKLLFSNDTIATHSPETPTTTQSPSLPTSPPQHLHFSEE